MVARTNLTKVRRPAFVIMDAQTVCDHVFQRLESLTRGLPEPEGGPEVLNQEGAS